MPIDHGQANADLADEDGVFCDLAVHAAKLDRVGRITAVNARWRRLADKTGLKLPNHGIGETIFATAPFTRPTSNRLILELAKLLSGQADLVTFIYPDEVGGEQRWYVMLGFPDAADDQHVLLIHIDVTAFVRATASPLAASGFQEEAIGQGKPAEAAFPDCRTAEISKRIEHLFSALLTETGAGATGRSAGGEGGNRGGRKKLLSKRQRDVLALMAEGLNNAAIARKLGLSENTVKIHVSGILTRLRLESRAQVVHWALTHDPEGD